ncbi:TPA: hypothetical protein HA318_05035 [Candidatus Micrarchaeota archaeon]|nr:MAG: hypothetical protein AUJ65_05900 [Candidatus Micrarchaeota archaeon CG1_02_51_15]HII39337.1 hypothetical protein [Candidatus Micrarchaeota archaeon]
MNSEQTSRIKAFRVIHVVATGSPVVRSKQVDALQPHLIQVSREASRIGVEAEPSKPAKLDDWRAFQGYFHGVHNRARRLGLQTVPLEENKTASFFRLLDASIASALASKKQCRAPKPDLSDGPDLKLEAAKRVSLLIAREMPGSVEDKRFYLSLLSDALVFERSLQMHSTAKRKRLSHIVVGAAHAADLQVAGKATASFVGVRDASS